MILKNYWNYRTAVENKAFKINEGYSELVTGAKAIDGSNVVLCGGTAGGDYYQYGEDYSLRTRLTLRVGSGNTAPTDTDYALENDVTNNISDYQVNVLTSSDDNSYKTIITASGMCNSENGLTIREIGVGKPYHNPMSPDQILGPTLFIRHILDDPITLVYGDRFSLVFECDEA